jgi:hypothetical protein
MPKRISRTRFSRGSSVPSLLGEAALDDGVLRAHRALVLDEVREARVLVLADRRLEADRLLRDLEDGPHLVERKLHLRRKLLGGRLAAERLHEVALRAHELVDRLDHVDGDADRARLVAYVENL